MSKTFRSFLLIFAVSVQILHLFNNSKAQDIEARVEIDADSPAAAHISGRYLQSGSRKNLSFLLDYAGVSGLGERFADVRLSGSDDTDPVSFTRMIAGEYLADRGFESWKYSAALGPLTKPSAAAHVSWLGRDGGILFLDDLLPQPGPGKSSARIRFDVPPGWKIFSAERGIGLNLFEVANVAGSAFYLGAKTREKIVATGKSRLRLIFSGEWLFTDEEAAVMASSIFGEHERDFGSGMTGDFVIGIHKFPTHVAAGNWEADTRGRTVTIVSSDMPFRSQSLQRLHEQLRHEIFHLWIPNGLNLTGNYDWFYEGFALYRSLKIGVGLNRIRFDDFLDTLSRAYDIDRLQSQKLSLIDASKNRWNGANTQVYARGILVAFLCDLALLERSRGKRSVSRVLREIYEKHRSPSPAQEGNSAILGFLRTYPELVSIVDANVTNAENVDWTTLLKAAGIEAERKDQLTKLKITNRPSGRQKEILDKLGYNNWRKLSLE